MGVAKHTAEGEAAERGKVRESMASPALDDRFPPMRKANAQSHSVVQRQMWLMEKEGLSKSDAYDQARREFYRARARQDVERYVAKEEALSTGAYFGKSPIQIGAELEDQAVERYKSWLVKTSIEVGRQRQVRNSGSAIPEPSREENGSRTDEADNEVDELDQESVAEEKVT